ncbi:DUF3592 domain-containing protein, partial [bacterium]|nr:DUF3592 domain-containing protein [bacterium]
MARRNKSQLRSRRQEVQAMLKEIRPGCLLGIWLLLGLPFVALGVFFLYQGATEAVSQASFHSRAVETSALILSSDILRPVGAQTDSSSFFPKIEFAYQYQGADRRSDRVWIVSEAGAEKEILVLIGRFPEGARVTAFLDPQSPEMTVLE